MDESLFAGIALIVTGLPGMAIGLAILIGMWRPASLAAARDPERARVATGSFLLLVDALLVALGAVLIVMPTARLDQVALWGTIAVVAASTLGVIPLLRAVRA